MYRYIYLLIILSMPCALRAQNGMNLLSDTVRITSPNDSAELVLRNHSRSIQGVLFNKGNGATEFRILKFVRKGDSTLAILGVDTTAISGGGSGGSVYVGEPDVLLSVMAQDATHMQFRWWKTDNDLYQSAKIGVIGDSQGQGDFPSAYQFSIVGRLQNFIYAVANNDAVTNYCRNGYNSRRLAPTGSNPYVDNQYNITKALNDGNKIIVLCNTSNDFYSGAAGGLTTVSEAMANTLLIADACEKAGATLFVISSFPRTQADRPEWDSLRVMAGLLNQKFGSRCAYVYKLLEDPANPMQLNPALQVGDNIHLNDQGSNIVYSAVRDMLTSYYTANTNVSKYQLQRANKYNGSFSDYQWPSQPNNPATVLTADSAFYRIRVVYNSGYYSKWSNIVQGTTAHPDSVFNQPPLLSVSNPQIVLLPATTVSLTASASSPNAGGTISSYNWFKVMGGAATITSPSSPNTTATGLGEGRYVFRCQATDNNGLVSYADAVVTVETPDSNNTAAKFNFNIGAQNINGWIDVSGGPLASDNNGRVWTDNIHNISLKLIKTGTAYWGDFYGDGSNSNGSDVPDAGAYAIPMNVILSSWYTANIFYNDSSSDQLLLTGLSPAKKYKLKIYSSLKASFGLDGDPTVAIVNDNLFNQKQVNANGNTSVPMIFRGIVPNTNGEVRIFIGSAQGLSQYGLINGLVVQEDSLTGTPAGPTVTGGGNKTLQMPNNSTTISVTADDPDAAITGVTWTQISGPAGAVLLTPSALSTTVNNLSAGTYVFRCTVTDTYGGTGHADITVTVSPASGNPTLYVGVTKLNFAYTAAGWTIMSGTPTAAVVTASATLGSIPVSISSVATGNYAPFLGSYSSDQTGETTDDGGGFLAPLRQQQGNWFTENAYDPAKPQIQITGLAAGTYKVTMFGSLQASFAIDCHTEYRVNGSSPVTVDDHGNTSHAAVFTGISVSAGGTLNLFFNPTTPNSDTSVGLLSYFIIEKTN